MSTIYPPQPPRGLAEFAEKVGLFTRRPPNALFSTEESIPLHATRLLLLLHLAGRPINQPRIEGRTKLAKLDFFVRYPQFLEKAARILSADKQLAQLQEVTKEGATVESHMIRYRYGPWDQKYYLVLAYLSGKALIDVRPQEGVDRYSLTYKGQELAVKLEAFSEFQILAVQSRIVGDLFGQRRGSWIKDFIYRHFPEVVRTPYNQIIVKADGNE
ncbi:hypothetical protein ANRL4_05602 [Anaerolineae bacterium]|nr:hypothetical protein ANRL4_05602 [Anaerolineae bacterium]